MTFVFEPWEAYVAGLGFGVLLIGAFVAGVWLYRVYPVRAGRNGKPALSGRSSGRKRLGR